MEYTVGTIDNASGKFEEVPNWAREIASKTFDVRKEVESVKESEKEADNGIDI